MAKPVLFRASRAGELHTGKLKESLLAYKDLIEREGRVALLTTTKALLEHLQSMDSAGFDGLHVSQRDYKNKYVVFVDGKNKRNINVFAILDRGANSYLIKKPFFFQSYEPRGGITADAEHESPTEAFFSYEIVESARKSGAFSIDRIRSRAEYNKKKMETWGAKDKRVESGRKKAGAPKLIYMGPYKSVGEGKNRHKKRRVKPAIEPRNFYDDIASSVAVMLAELIERSAPDGFRVRAEDFKMYISVNAPSPRHPDKPSQRRYKIRG